MEGVFDGFIDPRLEREFDSEEMMRLIACAVASIRHSAKRRAKMSKVIIFCIIDYNNFPYTFIRIWFFL